jgi:D-alanyl-D-alanine carboxypeptidase/D-alanyl-D-alanine-endopeptidase (penicillin-binding protein 4)
MRIFCLFFTLLFLLFVEKTVSQPSIERFLSAHYMKGASVSFMVKDILHDTVLYRFDADREVTPASVMKIVTTATALEILGDLFRYETTILYDGALKDSILEGNLYIRGSGDPTLGSSEVGADRDKIMRSWIKFLKSKGLRMVNGSVIADESIFDSEGISLKLMLEDMGNYYAPGSYGINIFDNRYSLFLRTGELNSKPEIVRTDPIIPSLRFYNQLLTAQSDKDSMYITGFPFSNERYLFGTVPANRSQYQLKGDIPEPSLFLAQYFTKLLQSDSIRVSGEPSCYRILSLHNDWQSQIRHSLMSSYSMPLKELVRITNFSSHNLYADILLKTMGLKYKSEVSASSFAKGATIVKDFWEEKGLNTSSLWMYDGCGLAATDKLTASFVCELLTYMYKKSPYSKSFIESLPRAGMEGTVANMLESSSLHGVAHLKSGSMNRVRSYAGYIFRDGKVYAVAILVNNFSCTQAQIKTDIEQLVLSLS